MEAITVDVENEIRRIGIEIEAVGRKIKRLESENDSENRDSHLTAIAAILQSIYNGYERVLEILIKAIDGDLPTARDYHIALLRRAVSPIADIRPSILNQKTFEILDDIRKYRHVFRNIYHYQLKPGKVRLLAEMGISAYNLFKIDIEEFLKKYMA